MDSNKLFSKLSPDKIVAPADFISGAQQRYAYGNEIFVNVIFYDGTVQPNYYISNYGRIWCVSKQDFLSPFIDEKGYSRVTLWRFPTKNGIRNSIFTGVHKLELMSFIPITEADYYIPNHRDGNTSNNWLGNLEWVTPSENTTHAIDAGLSDCKGENNARSYLSEAQIHVICQGLEKGLSTAKIANTIGYVVPDVTQDVRNRVCAIIRNIKYGDTYRDIADQYNIPGAGGVYRYPDEMVEKVCKVLNEGNFETYKDVAEILGIPKKDRIRFRIYVDDILKGKTGTRFSRQYDYLKKPSSKEIE